MAVLRTDFQDDILNSSMDEKRRYKLIQNSDGTVSLEDVSVYDQVGSEFGAAQINATNEEVNEKIGAADLVDPMVATEEGFAADALKVKEALDEQNKKMLSGYENPTVIALVSDGAAYTDESGNYILAESTTGIGLLADTETYTTITVEGNFYRMAGADSVNPFKGGAFKELGIIVSTGAGHKWGCLLDSNGHAVVGRTGDYFYITQTGDYLCIYYTGDNVLMKVLQDCTAYFYNTSIVTENMQLTAGTLYQLNVQYTGTIIVTVL